MKQTVIELTAPNGQPYSIRFPEPIIAMCEPWAIQTETAHIIGTRVTMVGLGAFLCQESYEQVKELFKPQGRKPKLQPGPGKVIPMGEKP
jgi:hypothetical protein